MGDTWAYGGVVKTWYGALKGWVTTGDRTGTVIDNGLITSGTIQLGDASAAAKAGITGAGNSDDSVRIWAGSAATGMNTAPFQVLQSGKVRASDAEIRGHVEATSGKIAGFNIEGSALIHQEHGPGHGLMLNDMLFIAWANFEKTQRVFIHPAPMLANHDISIEYEPAAASVSSVIKQDLALGGDIASRIAVFYADYIPGEQDDTIPLQEIYAFYANKGDIVAAGGQLVGRQRKRTKSLQGSGALGLSALGSRIMLTSSEHTTINLPDTALCKEGDSIEFVSVNARGTSIRAHNTSSILFRAGVVSNNYPLPAYARAELVFYNGKWIVIE